MKQQIRAGTITSTNVRCKCGGMGMLQEWLEPKLDGTYKRCAMVFCQECDRRTRIKAERTPRETKQEAVYEWKNMNIRKDNK